MVNSQAERERMVLDIKVKLQVHFFLRIIAIFSLNCVSVQVIESIDFRVLCIS